MKTLKFLAFGILAFGISALRAATPLTDAQLGGSNNQVKSGATLTILSGGNLTIASGGTFTFTSGTIVGTWAIANGGTGATTASAARTALGLAIGTNVQAYDADLTTYAGITPSSNMQSFLAAADYAAMRTLLALTIGTNVQAYDADLTTYAGITPSANIQTFLGAADYAAMRTQLALTIGTNVQAYDADLTTYAGITPSANVQTLLGAADYAAFRTSLGVGINPMTTSQDIIVGGSSGTPTRLGKGSDGQVLKVVSGSLAWDTDSTGSGALPGTPSTGDLAYYDGANWVSLAIGTAKQTLKVNSGATAPEWASGTGTAAVTTSTGTQNDVSFSGAAVLFCNNATLLTITGLVAGTDGQTLKIVSKGAGQVNLSNQAGGSTSANRIINQVTGTISLAAGVGTAELVYDATATRWRVTAHEQGAAITVAYSGGDFTGSGTLTWTVESGDLTFFHYILRGRMLKIWFKASTSSVSGSGSELRFTIPGGFTIARDVNGFVAGADSGTALPTDAFLYCPSGQTYGSIFRNVSGSNWTAASNTTNVFVEPTIEVQ